ncbi:MAG TPA: NADH-quinone oxidoreductase subunit C, partial [Anaerolineaceae bacterium]
MDEKLHAAAQAVQERFGAAVQEQAGEVSLLVKPDQIIDACRLLRSDFGFNMLVNETAVDYWPAETPRFHVIYHLHAIPGPNRISLRVP